MSSKKNRNQGRGRSEFRYMIAECPVCRARSYPRVFQDPQNEAEKEAIFCGSCKTNLRPFIDYAKMQEAKAEAQRALAQFEAKPGESSVPPQILADMAGVKAEVQ